MAVVIGVDEAGRGPVLGSMFVAAVRVPDTTTLPEGVRDSKQIPDEERARIADAIIDDPRIDAAVIEVSVDEIDAGTGRLNQVTANASRRAISAVDSSNFDGVSVLVDACDPDERRYADSVARGIDTAVDIVAEHGADDRYPPVSAASIVAKEAREAHVASLCERYGTVGSGYPSDPTTRRFLASYLSDHGELPACARTTWKTCADIRTSVNQGQLSSY